MLLRALTFSISVMIILVIPAIAMAGFSDVPRGHWAYDAIDYLESEGLVTGFPDGTFRGDNNLTRYEFAIVISRLNVQLMEMLDGIDTPEPSIDVLAILDMLIDEFEPDLDNLRALIVDNIGRIEDVEGFVDEMGSTVDDLNSRINDMDNRFHTFGDLRLRFEGKYPEDGLQTQRPRFRLRWGFTSSITDELTFGARLASGSEGGITSTNRTIGDAFGYDEITIDRAYLQYSPESAPDFRVWAGKFSPAWHTTVLSADSDVMFEGLAQHYNYQNFNFYLAELIPSQEGYYLIAQAGADDLIIDGFDFYATYHYFDDNCWHWIRDAMENGDLKSRFDFSILDDPDSYSALELYSKFATDVSEIPVTLEGSYYRNLADAAPGMGSALNQAAWARLSVNGSPHDDGEWRLRIEYGKVQRNSVLSWLTDADRGSGDHEWWGANWTYRLTKNTDLGITWLSVDRLSRSDHYDLFQVDVATKF